MKTLGLKHYSHPEMDRIWIIQGRSIYIYIYTHIICIYIYIYIYMYVMVNS